MSRSRPLSYLFGPLNDSVVRRRIKWTNMFEMFLSLLGGFNDIRLRSGADDVQTVDSPRETGARCFYLASFCVLILF